MRFLSLCGCFAPTKDTENAHTMSNVNYSFYRLVKNINRRAWNRACYRTWAVRFVSSHSFESVKLFASTWVTILLRAGDGTYVECVTNVKLVLYGNGWAASPHWKLSDACDFVAFTYIRRVSAFKTFSLTRPGGRYRPHRKGVTTIFFKATKKVVCRLPVSVPLVAAHFGFQRRKSPAGCQSLWGSLLISREQRVRRELFMRAQKRRPANPRKSPLCEFLLNELF